jgi:hypothetical protein
MGLESVFPGEELFFRQLVDLAGLLDGDHTCLHCDNNRGLTTYYPSAGVRRWQTFFEKGLDQRIAERRFDGAIRRMHIRPVPPMVNLHLISAFHDSITFLSQAGGT